MGESFLKSIACLVKMGESFDLQRYQNSPHLFFTGRKLHPPVIRIEATAKVYIYIKTVALKIISQKT